MSREVYQRNAAECMTLASEIDNEKDRLALLAMAQAWLKLAEYSFAFEDVAKIASAAIIQSEAQKDE